MCLYNRNNFPTHYWSVAFVSAALFFLVAVTGCGKGTASAENEKAVPGKTVTTVKEKSGSIKEVNAQKENIQGKGSYSVKDDAGRTVVLKEKPKRIVSITYGTDEILKVLAGPERIAAYSRHALHPDLVVVSTSTGADVLQTLESMGMTVYVAMSPKTYPEMKQKVRNLGLAAGEPEKTEALLKRMDTRMGALEKRLQALPDEKRKTAVAFTMTGPMGRKGELFDSMLNLAHVINGAATVHPLGVKGQISKEQVVQVNPDIFLLPTWNYDKHSDPEKFARELKEDPAFQNVKAVKNNQLVYISDRYRFVASHHMVDAVENIAYAVYPELFPEGKPKDQE